MQKCQNGECSQMEKLNLLQFISIQQQKQSKGFGRIDNWINEGSGWNAELISLNTLTF